MIRVVIADDHAIFRQGLIRLLGTEDDIRVIGEAGNGPAAADIILKMRPDLAIVDISMPERSGIETVRDLRNKGIKTKVILLTMHSDAVMLGKAVTAGIEGYVLKDDAFDDLLGAIREVAAGRRFVSHSIAGVLADIRFIQKKEGFLITRREKEVLELIVAGMSNKQIAERLFISVKTVDTHRTRIMQKLDIHKVSDLVRYAINEGLI